MRASRRCEWVSWEWPFVDRLNKRAPIRITARWRKRNSNCTDNPTVHTQHIHSRHSVTLHVHTLSTRTRRSRPPDRRSPSRTAVLNVEGEKVSVQKSALFSHGSVSVCSDNSAFRYIVQAEEQVSLRAAEPEPMPLSGPTAYRSLVDLGQPAIGNTAKFVMLLAGAAQGTASRLHMSMALACSCWFNCGTVMCCVSPRQKL